MKVVPASQTTEFIVVTTANVPLGLHIPDRQSQNQDAYTEKELHVWDVAFSADSQQFAVATTHGVFVYCQEHRGCVGWIHFSHADRLYSVVYIELSCFRNLAEVCFRRSSEALRE